MDVTDRLLINNAIINLMRLELEMLPLAPYAECVLLVHFEVHHHNNIHVPRKVTCLRFRSISYVISQEAKNKNKNPKTTFCGVPASMNCGPAFYTMFFPFS